MHFVARLNAVQIRQSHIAIRVVMEHAVHELEQLFAQVICANFFQIPLRELYYKHHRTGGVYVHCGWGLGQNHCLTSVESKYAK